MGWSAVPNATWTGASQLIDVRRALPAYVERPCEPVHPAPYQAARSELDVFVLPADRAALQQLVDTELGACVAAPAVLGSQRGLHFVCCDPWVVFIYAAMPRLRSMDGFDGQRGYLHSLELSIWVPIEKRREVGGPIISEPAWFLPLLFTSPTAAASTGREVYGFPKVPAQLIVPEGGGAPTAVGGPGALFAAQPVPAADQAGRALVDTAVRRYLKNAPLIFHKQVGVGEVPAEGRPRQLSTYTALVEARVPMGLPRGLHARAATFDFSASPLEANVAQELGLPARATALGVRLRGCTLDIQQGEEIWLAQDPVDRKQPRLASAWGPDVRTTTIDIDDGSAEVYFGCPQRQGIARLLEAHFPTRIAGRPTHDPARDFVLFLLARSKLGEEPGRTELSVWVPVLFHHEPAWYAPYMFRSSPPAVLHARECFGHVCQHGSLAWADDDDDPVHRLMLLRPTADGSGQPEWSPGEGATFAPTVWPSGHRPPEPGADRLRLELDDQPQRVVSLLQARHVADPRKACLQQTLLSYRTLRGALRPQPMLRRVSFAPHLQLDRLLSDPVLHGYRLDDVRITSSRGPTGEGTVS